MLPTQLSPLRSALTAAFVALSLAGCNPLHVTGSITGLTADGLVLANGADTVTPAAGATSFAFPALLKAGDPYDVQVQTQPTDLQCTVANGAGVITDKPVTDVAVTCVPAPTNLPDWATYQGNAGHTGYVPITVTPAQISQRWQWNNPDQASPLTTVATTGNQLFVANSAYFSTTTKLFALKEADGSLTWSKEFGSLYALNPPATANGRVYIASAAGFNISPYLWSLNATDGTVIFRTPFAAQWEHYLAPTIKEDKVYFDGGMYGGMYAMNTSDGTQAWFQNGLEQYDTWTPAVDGQYAYAYVGKTFTALNIADGSIAFQIPDATTDWIVSPMNVAPVLGSSGNVIVLNVPNHANSLRSYSIANKSLSWSVPGQFASNPALANGVIYITNASPFRLEARKEADGSLLWSWTPPDAATTAFQGNILVTDNVVFVGTNTGTVAIDLTNHAPVWSVPTTGTYAISARGIFYITTGDAVRAFSIR